MHTLPQMSLGFQIIQTPTQLKNIPCLSAAAAATATAPTPCPTPSSPTVVHCAGCLSELLIHTTDLGVLLLSFAKQESEGQVLSALTQGYMVSKWQS